MGCVPRLGCDAGRGGYNDGVVYGSGVLQGVFAPIVSTMVVVVGDSAEEIVDLVQKWLARWIWWSW